MLLLAALYSLQSLCATGILGSVGDVDVTRKESSASSTAIFLVFGLAAFRRLRLLAAADED